MAIITDLDRRLERWKLAGVVNDETAARIRQFEAESRRGSDLLVRIALAFGAVMVAGGVLLFVAAHWEELSPAERFALVLAMVAVCHCAGAFFADRSRLLAGALHATGTIALGGGIFVAGQIFNLQEHWPGGVLLWAVGSASGWALLGGSAQGVLTALLVPGWLIGEWQVRTENVAGSESTVLIFIALLALTYCTSRRASMPPTFRRAINLLGTVALLPSCIAIIEWSHATSRPQMDTTTRMVGLVLAVGLPLVMAAWYRRTSVWLNAVGAVWVLVLSALASWATANDPTLYLWSAVGSGILVAWGMREVEKTYINLGVVAFGLTVMVFYFSSVMDKLGRSMALIIGGLLFLAGGYFLERLRRNLVARVPRQEEAV